MRISVSSLVLDSTLPTVAMAIVACDTAPKSEVSRGELTTRVKDVIRDMKARDPGMEEWFTDSYGYAVMPDTSKGVGDASVGGQGFRFVKLSAVK
jgi:hypothetical protein